MNDLSIKDFKVTCDQTNNPPSSVEKGKLNISLQLSFSNDPTNIAYFINLPVDLERLKNGTLESVKLNKSWEDD